MADTVSQLLRELKPTEQKELLCNRCCWLLSSLRVRLETSQRATVVARGAIPEDLLAKVTGVAMGPCFPGWGPEELFQMCLPGSSASALAGPSEAYASSVGPREAPPKHGCWEVTPQPQHGWLLPAGSAGHRGPGFWPALAAVPPGGDCRKSQPGPGTTSFYFYATRAVRRASVPSKPCFCHPSRAWLLQVTAQACGGQLLSPGHTGHRRGAVPLRAFALLLLGCGCGR